jgi:hypothetical protein
MNINRAHLPLLAPVLVVAFAAGCGGGNDNSTSSASPDNTAMNDAAAVKAKQAADRVVKATPDKNLPGPKRYLSVCQQRGDPDASEDIPPNVVKCHIEAFYKDYRGKPGGYIWSEDWSVPIQNGKLGTPVIMGAYRIRDFLREDNKRNCTGRHIPRLCLPQSDGGVLPG